MAVFQLSLFFVVNKGRSIHSILHRNMHAACVLKYQEGKRNSCIFLWKLIVAERLHYVIFFIFSPKIFHSANFGVLNDDVFTWSASFSQLVSSSTARAWSDVALLSIDATTTTIHKVVFGVWCYLVLSFSCRFPTECTSQRILKIG